MRPSVFLTLFVLVAVPNDGGDQDVHDAATHAYLASLDPARFARHGSDFTNPWFDPERIGKPIEEIDASRDYDLERLVAIEERLSGVARSRVLRAIFANVTHDATTDHERHLAVLDFLQRAGRHNRIQPLDERGELVCDPLVLLELGEMRCGHVPRVAIDLFLANGYRARGVALGRHIVAEVSYDGAWHYLDADCTGVAATAINEAGVIPSIVELSAHPEWLDALPARLELCNGSGPHSGGPSRSWAYFSAVDLERFYFSKRSPDGAAPADDRYYGWRDIIRTPADWSVAARPVHRAPRAVRWRSVERHPPDAPTHVRLEWKRAKTHDGIAVGYRVFVASRPRGWSYARFVGAGRAETFWSSRDGWAPEMYDALHRLPPHDVALVETTEPHADVAFGDREALFVTVVAFDAYHAARGRTIFVPSNELRITRTDGPIRSAR